MYYFTLFHCAEAEATWHKEEEPKQRAEKFYLDKPRLLLATTLSLSVYIVDRGAS
jgi:hypothetical protein